MKTTTLAGFKLDRAPEDSLKYSKDTLEFIYYRDPVNELDKVKTKLPKYDSHGGDPERLLEFFRYLQELLEAKGIDNDGAQCFWHAEQLLFGTALADFWGFH